MDIRDTLLPGDIGTIVTLHGQHYAENWGFGTFFEAKVARELADFAARKSPDDLTLIAQDENGPAASLILDLNDPASNNRGAHLRWFICADRCRGTGIGRKLMEQATAHADAHANGRIWLTTFAGLHSARHLYEAFGFSLTSEHEGSAWGTRVTEQEFQR